MLDLGKEQGASLEAVLARLKVVKKRSAQVIQWIPLPRLMAIPGMRHVGEQKEPSATSRLEHHDAASVAGDQHRAFSTAFARTIYGIQDVEA